MDEEEVFVEPTDTEPVEITEDEKKFLEALHLLGIKPVLTSPEEVMKLLKVFGTVKAEDEPSHAATPAPAPKSGTFHFPKFSTFYGDEGKGEVTWVTFKYEVESVITDKVFNREQILLGIRRSLKGSASDKIRRLGPGATVEQILEKLDSDYGTVESKESAMRKFYSCQQKSDESIEKFASRLEELFDQAVKLKVMKRTDTDVLKEVLHAGLNKELKHMSSYQNDKIKDYDEFKRELRKMEEDMKESSCIAKEKTCKAAIVTERKESSELGEVKEFLRQINSRMDTLEKQQQHFERGPRFSFGGQNFNRGRGRGFNQGPQRGGGRGNFRPQRPTAGNTFQPTCYFCGKKGHLQRDCLALQKQQTVPVCYTCNQPGHMQRDCPLILDQIICHICKGKGHKMKDCPKA